MTIEFGDFLAAAVLVTAAPGADAALTIRNSLFGGRSAGITTGHPLENGDDVFVWNRSPAPIAPLVAAGAIATRTRRQATANVEPMITILADPRALHAVTEGDNGVAEGVHDRLPSGRGGAGSSRVWVCL